MSSDPGLFELTRTPVQIAALRDMCESWHSGPEHFWEFDSVLDAMSRPGSMVVFAAETAESSVWVGAALVDVGPYSADLLYIYTRPEYRRRQLARRLMGHVLMLLADKPQIESLFLEVRVSNTGAQRLYQSLGMELVGTRKRYYANGEDALIYKIKPVHGD
jgi:ribosomal-protein-alanine N-acetyltransferase